MLRPAGREGSGGNPDPAGRRIWTPSGHEVPTMLDLPTSGSPRVAAMVRQSFTAMTRQERRRVIAMFGVIAGLHVLGFFVLFVFVVPSHYKGLGIGVSILAYTLGLRHAFDADHISAIDNTIRKLLSERQNTGQPRPFGLGFFFSLGHSTVVVVIGIGIVVAEKTVFHAVSDSRSGLEQFGGCSAPWCPRRSC
jgi:high-affinity nickel permease